MISPKSPLQLPNLRLLFPAFAALALVGVSGTGANGQSARLVTLRIGASGTLTGKADDPKEKAGLKSLRRFIKDETGLNNEVFGQMNWQSLADKMAKGELHLAFFQGYEFAWAQEKYPNLKPLALAVNIDRYPIVYLLARRDNAAKDFAGLRNQSLSLPVTSHGFPRLYLERQAEANGKKVEAFFSKLSSPDNVEDAIDDVVDGKVQVAAIDRAALEAYKRRKPGRFKKLKEVTRSQPFPPGVVAYYGTVLDQATLLRFKNGLLGAAKKKKGETLLTLSRLTGFESVPRDFGQALAETRKAYPAHTGQKKK
jgi:ABC-type phosphate/phosphonate transport system substrate-binding protein